MAATVTVRAAREHDREGIVAIYNHYVEHTAATFEVLPVSVADRGPWFDEHTESGPHRLLVASDDRGQVLGWASTSPFRPRAAYSTTVESSAYCRPDVVGLGLGSRLYNALFRSIREEDVERIVAGVTLPNPASLALHRRFGFRPVGTFTRVGRKFGRFWNVAWFERPARLDAEASGTVAASLTPTSRGGPSRSAGDRRDAADQVVGDR